MKKFYAFLVFVIFVVMFVIIPTPVGASTIIIDDSKYVSNNYNFADVSDGHNQPLACIGFQNAKDLSAPFTIVGFGHLTGPPNVYAGNCPVVLICNGKIVGNGTESFQIFPNSPESSYVVLTVDDFDGTLVGNGQGVIMGGREEGLRFHTGYKTNYVYGPIEPPYAYAGFGYDSVNTYWRFGDAYTLNTYFDYKTSIEYVEEDSEPLIIDNISQTRIIDGKSYPAQSVLKGKSGVEYWNSTGSTPLNAKISANDRPYTLTIYSEILDRWYTYTLYESAVTPTPTPAEDPTVTVYIKNSQTGALIADANVVIDALVNGEYYPVVNRTEPSGIFSITLQPTGGGQPNPDGYRLIVTADGYNNPMPEINFTVDDYKLYIYCLLDPIAGGPVNENKTFIDFFVRDMSSNPISGATVKFGKYTLITNSQGYTVFEVDKSNTYSWTVSKSGYGALTGNAVIGDAPRHTINTVLAPSVTPTPQTPIPTGPAIGPTPTMTAPTGEPVSNWLEWFAAHFGMILGGGAEIGKIFMWLCFAVPVGVYVGKEAKAGAAGFMAGAGIVTLFFALIGWVPIWLLVLLALIIGLLYAKVFNNPDNGGGR